MRNLPIFPFELLKPQQVMSFVFLFHGIRKVPNKEPLGTSFPKPKQKDFRVCPDLESGLRDLPSNLLPSSKCDCFKTEDRPWQGNLMLA